MLPGSQLLLSIREPASDDELFVLETSLDPFLAVLELGRRVAAGSDARPVDWEHLPATDVAAVALTIRQAWLGDRLATEGACPTSGCGAPIDVAFGVGAYLEHHRPRSARGAGALREEGWYVLKGTDVRFRVPEVGDVLAARTGAPSGGAGGSAGGVPELTRRCVQPTELAARTAARVERALSALSPSLDGFVGGFCPACGSSVQLRFDPCTYVMAELRDAFSGIFLETHILAARYGWAEEAILRLPRRRRLRYASLAADHLALA